jgi:hypothetical protein
VSPTGRRPEPLDQDLGRALYGISFGSNGRQSPVTRARKRINLDFRWPVALAQLYKDAEPDGTYRGRPAYYIERGLGRRWLAAIFSVLLLVTFGFGFSALQSYTVASSFHDAFGIPTLVTGLALVVVLGLIIFGGVKRSVRRVEMRPLAPPRRCTVEATGFSCEGWSPRLSP